VDQILGNSVLTKYKVHTLVIGLEMNSNRKRTRHVMWGVGVLQYMDKNVRIMSNELI
jgi:hypothetical protein